MENKENFYSYYGAEWKKINPYARETFPQECGDYWFVTFNKRLGLRQMIRTWFDPEEGFARINSIGGEITQWVMKDPLDMTRIPYMPSVSVYEQALTFEYKHSQLLGKLRFAVESRTFLETIDSMGLDEKQIKIMRDEFIKSMREGDL